MHKIFDANNDFPFDSLVLTTPIVITSGVYFIKYLIDNEAIYIQPPKCITRQGIIKGSKKMYCDLLFTNENNSFIKWIEDLESYSHSYIYTNRERWFDSQLELEDIADSFLSILKIYKSGKYYILRTMVPGNINQCSLKLYDENESQVNLELLTDSTNVIPILEFKGIKCTTRNFQVDIEIKQMMILKPTKLFEKCVIRNNNDSLGKSDVVQNDISETHKYGSENVTLDIEGCITQNSNLQKDSSIKSHNETLINEPIKHNINIQDSFLEEKIDNTRVNPILEKEIDNTRVVPIPEEEIYNHMTNSCGLQELDLDNESINAEDVITLTSRNEVYYKIYQEAMKKAKEAKNLAISSYLEAKQIKNLYMLDDMKV